MNNYKDNFNSDKNFTKENIKENLRKKIKLNALNQFTSFLSSNKFVITKKI